MPADFESTARALALPVDSPIYEDSLSSPTSIRPLSPTWARPHSSSFRRGTHGRHNSAHATSASSHHRRNNSSSMFGRMKGSYHAYMRTYYSLPLSYQIALSTFGLVSIILAILFVVYQGRIWAALVPRAEAWGQRTGGWLLLWFVTVGVAFPPMIGYGTCVTLAGFIYGVWKGWLIAASATIIGSTLSFLASRHLIYEFVARLLTNSSHATTFTALSSTLAHDGLSILIMLRLCPLPYSLSNGAIATLFPPSSIRWPAFMVATTVATPKLLIMVFIGSRVAAIAKSGGEMSWRDKCVNYGGIVMGMAIGIGTGIVIYRKTKRRAAELEAEGKGSGASGGASRRLSSGSVSRTTRGGGARQAFVDDPEAANEDRDVSDDISLQEHTAFEVEEDDEEMDIYRDDVSDDDTSEGDVFTDAGAGAGHDSDVEAARGGARREKPGS